MVKAEAQRPEAAVKANTRSRLFFVLRKAWKRRSAQGISAKDLAQSLGRDKAQVSRVLNGRTSTITAETLALFLERLDHELIIDCRPFEDAARSNIDVRPAEVHSMPIKPMVVVVHGDAAPTLGVQVIR